MTELYHRAINECCAEHRELMISEWTPTPWMIDVAIGAQREELRGWCYRNLGPESSPMHGHKGIWRQSNVTMNDKSWFGFETEELMARFQASLKPEVPLALRDTAQELAVELCDYECNFVHRMNFNEVAAKDFVAWYNWRNETNPDMGAGIPLSEFDLDSVMGFFEEFVREQNKV